METRGDEIGKPMVNLENEDFDQHLSKEYLAGLTKGVQTYVCKYRSDAWKFRRIASSKIKRLLIRVQGVEEGVPVLKR